MNLNFLGRLTLLTTTIGSITIGCASTSDSELPKASLYAPAEVVQPFIPSGESVNPAATNVLTLDQLLVYADAHSPAILVAQNQVGLADAEIVGADIFFPANPQVDLSAGGRVSNGGISLEYEVGIEQQIEIAGEPGLRFDAARAQQRVAAATVNEVRWSAHVETHRLFVVLLLMKERLKQAERFVAFSQTMRNIAARQVEAGESSPLILLVADADLAQTREAVIETRQMKAALQTQLAAVIGWPSSSLEVSGELPAVRKAPSVEQLLNTMAKHHPSLRTRELALVAGRSRLKLEERDAWPEPSLGFSYSHEGAPLPESETDVWLFNLSIPVPLWRTNQGPRAQAHAEVLVADKQREATVIQLKSRLRQAAISLDAALERVALYETSVVPQLEKNLTLLQRAYELGEVDVHQVSQTRERLLRAIGRYLQARVVYYESTAALEGLVGTEIWSDTEVLQ